MSDFAVITTGAKQYRVSSGDRLKIEKIEGAVGQTVLFDKVLLRATGGNVAIGMPYIENHPGVSATIVAQERDRKKLIFKYHSKTRFHKTRGHRQYYTQVLITAL